MIDRPKREMIASAWQGFAKMVVPKDASQEQIDDTRRAFYSGAAVLFSIITGEKFFDGLPGDGDIEPTGADLEKMNDLQDEIDAFGAELDQAVFGIRRH